MSYFVSMGIMAPRMIKESIENFCHSIGVDTFGFIPCRKFEELIPFYEKRQKLKLQNEFEEEDIEKRINPFHYMEDAKTILSIAFPYYNPEEVHTDNGFSVYTKRMDYHKVVKSYLNQIITYIESLGGKGIGLVDSHGLPERYMAYLAGVGFIGKNNMLITKKYGSYVFLGEIITNLEIDCEEKGCFNDVAVYSECGSCDLCIKECPTKSIHEKSKNPNICLSYITQKKVIDDKEMRLLKGNIFGCDFCQLKCPYNEKIASSGLKEFQLLDYMNEDPAVYGTMTNQYFKEKINGTSCGWRGKNVIKRNALIHLHKNGYDVEALGGDSPYLNDYINRLKINKK